MPITSYMFWSISWGYVILVTVQAYFCRIICGAKTASVHPTNRLEMFLHVNFNNKAPTKAM